MVLETAGIHIHSILNFALATQNALPLSFDK